MCNSNGRQQLWPLLTPLVLQASCSLGEMSLLAGRGLAAQPHSGSWKASSSFTLIQKYLTGIKVDQIIILLIHETAHNFSPLWKLVYGAKCCKIEEFYACVLCINTAEAKGEKMPFSPENYLTTTAVQLIINTLHLLSDVTLHTKYWKYFFISF